MNQDLLELVVFEEDGPKHLKVWVARQGDRACHRVACDDAGIACAEAFVKTVEEMIQKKRGRPSPDEMRGVAEGLFEALFRGEAKTMFDRLPSGQAVTLAVVSSDARVLDLPWEYLSDPKAPVGPDVMRPVVRVVPFVRRPTTPMPAAKSPGDPVRVLFVVSEPKGVTDVGGYAQQEHLETLFKTFGANKVEFDVLPGRKPTTKKLRNALEKKAYDVVHFVGHGEAGALIFADQNEDKKPLAAEKLASLLQPYQIRMMVLAACRSASGAFDKEFAVVATGLVKNGIGAVVAMQFSIDPSTATEFVTGMYDYLLKGKDLDEACTRARHDLYSDLEDGSVEWGVPVLYRRLDAANPFLSSP